MTTQVHWQSATDTSGHPTRELTITRPDKRPVTGAIWLPAERQPGDPMILFGHGASGDRYQAPIPHLAKRFMQETGYAALSLDGPVHGLRKTGPGGRESFWPEFQRPECIDDMVEDWHLAIDAAQTLDEIGVGKLAYFGLSMGSIFGIPLVASRPDVSVAVQGLLGNAGPVHNERILADATKISCPVLFLMQLEDELFDRTGCLALFDALSSEDKRLHANPGLHPAVPAEEIDCSFTFLRDHLNGGIERRIIDPLAE